MAIPAPQTDETLGQSLARLFAVLDNTANARKARAEVAAIHYEARQAAASCEQFAELLDRAPARIRDLPRVRRKAVRGELPRQPLTWPEFNRLKRMIESAARRPVVAEGRRRRFPQITGTAERVCLYLLGIQRRHGSCHPDIRTIVKKTGKSRRSVFRALKQLEREDMLTRTERRKPIRKHGRIWEAHDTNEYRVREPKSVLKPTV